MEPRDLQDVLERHDPVATWITVFLVFATLFGAGIAWLQAQAHREHDEATVQAEQWSVLASSQQGRANQVALLSAGRRWRLRRDRIGAQQAAAAQTLAGGDSSLAKIEEAQWTTRAKVAEGRTEVLAEEEAAELEAIEAEIETAFPGIEPSAGLEASCEGAARAPPSAASYPRVREAYRMEGLRDAAEQTATQAEWQFTKYAIALAVIAVALFLFGYALTKYGRRYRRRFVAIGLGLTLGALVFAAIGFFGSPEKPPAEAAAAYADGQVALDHGEIKVALHDFRCANELNPDFAAAFLGRSVAIDQLRQRRGTSLINLGTLRGWQVGSSLRFAKRAQDGDSDDPRVLAQIATSLYIRGFRLHDRGYLEEALALNEQIEEELPEDPIAAFNAGAGRLALGGDWRETYEHAGELMLAASQPFEYVGTALTDIDTLQHSNLRPGIAADAREAKEVVVSLATGAPPPGADAGPAPATLHRVQLAVTPHVAAVTFDSPHPASDDVFVAIYRDEGSIWQELQLLTGFKVLEPPVNGRSGTALAYDTPTQCLESGTYKVELYLDGRLANAGGATEEEVRLPQLKRRILPGINVRLCVPPEADGWRKIAGRTVGLVDGFERRGRGRAGIVVADLSAAPVHGARALAALALRRFPAMPGDTRRVGPARRVAFGGPTEPNGTSARTEAAAFEYRYPGGRLTMAIGTTPIGRRLAIAVFGPPAFFAVRSGATQSMADSLFGSVGPQDVPPFTTVTDSGGG